MKNGVHMPLPIIVVGMKENTIDGSLVASSVLESYYFGVWGLGLGLFY